MVNVKEKLSNVGMSIRNWNAHRWHFPDVHDNPRFKLIATVITRIGFFAKFILYAAMALIAMVAAAGVNSDYEDPEGPQTVLVRLSKTFGTWVVGVFVVGLFCYSLFAFLFCVFDFDRLGHHAAFPILARFGRVFSAGFYGFIGIVGVQILINLKRGEEQASSTSIGDALFSTTAGQCVVVFLGVVFCIVAIVYLSYIIKPAKFRKELASERMPPWLFSACVILARIGAVGRVLFFGAFGVVLINAVAHRNGSTINGTTLFGLEGVLVSLAQFSKTLLFITGAFLFVYALWALVLCFFRRLPAHYNEAESLAAVGMRWRASKAKKEMQKHKADPPMEMADFSTLNVARSGEVLPPATAEVAYPVEAQAVAPEDQDLAASAILTNSSAINLQKETSVEEDDEIQSINKLEKTPLNLRRADEAHRGSPAGFASH